MRKPIGANLSESARLKPRLRRQRVAHGASRISVNPKSVVAWKPAQRAQSFSPRRSRGRRTTQRNFLSPARDDIGPSAFPPPTRADPDVAPARAVDLLGGPFHSHGLRHGLMDVAATAALDRRSRLG
jgi:hypothetical protein